MRYEVKTLLELGERKLAAGDSVSAKQLAEAGQSDEAVAALVKQKVLEPQG